MAQPTGKTPTGAGIDLLRTALQMAVPLEIGRVRGRSAKDRTTALEAIIGRGLIVEHGDELLYGGGRCAATFADLARALALLAFQPGGVQVAGLHFCAHPHPRCRRPRRSLPACCVCDRGACTAHTIDGDCPDPGCTWCATGCPQPDERCCMGGEAA